MFGQEITPKMRHGRRSVSVGVMKAASTAAANAAPTAARNRCAPDSLRRADVPGEGGQAAGHGDHDGEDQPDVGRRDEGDVETVEGVPPLVHQPEEEEKEGPETADDVPRRAAEAAAEDRGGPLQRGGRAAAGVHGGQQHHGQGGQPGDGDAAVEHQVRGGEEGVGADVGVPLHVPGKAKKGEEHAEQEPRRGGDAGAFERPVFGAGTGWRGNLGDERC